MVVEPEFVKVGDGTFTVKLFPVVGVTEAIPAPVIVGVTGAKVFEMMPPVMEIPVPAVYVIGIAVFDITPLVISIPVPAE